MDHISKALAQSPLQKKDNEHASTTEQVKSKEKELATAKEEINKLQM